MAMASDGSRRPESTGNGLTIERSRIRRYLETEAPHPLTVRALADGLGVPASARRALQRLLRRMLADGELVEVRGRRFAVPGRIRLVVGRFRALRRGSAIVTPDEGGEEVFVRAGDAESAVDGDRVAVRVEGRGRAGRAQGRVVEVLERSRRTIVGRYHAGESRRRRGGRPQRLGWVVPEDPAIARDVIATPDPDLGDVAPGDVVVVRIEDWGDANRGPSGVIEQVLGPPDAPGVDVLAIIHGHELPLTFPPAVEAEAETLNSGGVTAADLEGRHDLRGLLTFTIDPADAKDHDDALSYRALPGGQAEVGVHIADVSYYVRQDSALDAEAMARGTSVYLVDRVIPMLPHALSSHLCSLVPDQDRLTLSVLFTISAAGEVRSAELAASVIRSRHRLAYEQVQSVLDGASRVDEETDAALRGLDRFAHVLRRARFARGSLDFDLPEPRVLLDTDGEPIAVKREPRFNSHRLVEDLMLLANETIGLRAKRAGVPFVYRIHEPPDESRIAQVAELARALGYTPPPPSRPVPDRLQALLEQARERPEGAMVATLVLRALKQARYSETDAGHFGLAAQAYTHFTSPIRRYPDLVVHRITRARLLPGANASVPDNDRLRSIARHSSDRERIAQSAERDSVTLKKVRFMERQIGEVFEGTISDVRPFGFFVLLDAHYVDGLVHVSALDDYFRFVEERFLLQGERSGRRYTLGQRIQVRVAAVDVEERRVEFVPVQKDAARGTRSRRAPRSRRGR
jgi:ribonuclease R